MLQGRTGQFVHGLKVTEGGLLNIPGHLECVEKEGLGDQTRERALTYRAKVSLERNHRPFRYHVPAHDIVLPRAQTSFLRAFEGDVARQRAIVARPRDDIAIFHGGHGNTLRKTTASPVVKLNVYGLLQRHVAEHIARAQLVGRHGVEAGEYHALGLLCTG